MLDLFGDPIKTETRLCIHCEEEKPVSEMEPSYQYIAGKGVRNECIKCRKKIGKDLNRLRKEYVSLKPHINDICLICQRVGKDIVRGNGQGYHKKKEPWVLDHCHSTMKFRGWICNQCNTGLSRFNDNPTVLRNAANYIETIFTNSSVGRLTL